MSYGRDKFLSAVANEMKFADLSVTEFAVRNFTSTTA